MVQEWFPMRVTYSRELKVKAELDKMGVECFLPLRNETVIVGGKRHYKAVPAIHNLIFVRSTQDELTVMKQTKKELQPLRYIMTTAFYGEEAGTKEVMRVPDKQMENFMRVASVPDERVFFLDHADSHDSRERRVVITQGDFAGVEGTIRRIQKNKRVVVQLEGLAAVAIAFVPPSSLNYIDNTQNNQTSNH